MAVAFETLAGWLLARSEELLPQWLPAGKGVGPEWCVGDLQGNPGQSCRVNKQSGLWSDFGTGEKGRDLIALWAAIHRLSQIDAARDLAEKYGYGSIDSNVVPLRPVVADRQQEVDIVEPTPADAPLTPVTFKHRTHGIPSHVHVYRNADRVPLMVVARYETAEGKTFAPWTWREGAWRAKAHPSPRPLYGLDRIEGRAGVTIIVEGEKAADALQLVTTRSSVVTWAGGANSWKHADWSPLRGRTCYLWPDADPPGFAAMQGIAGVLLTLECTLQMIDTDGLPDAFDAADLIAQGVQGGELNAWLRARLKPVERAPVPQRVLAPKTIAPAVTVTQDGERVPQSDSDAPPYALAERYGLSFNKQGVHENMANVVNLIEGRIREGAWGAIYYDEFLQKTMIDGTPAREWAERDTLKRMDELQRSFGLVRVRKSVVEDAVTLYAYEHRRNSAQEWLAALMWDGTPRLNTLFPRGFGARSDEYTRSVSKCFLIGLVARVIDPGCQVDTLPVLEGSQGLRKTSALRVLGGEYHAECLQSAAGKDFYLILAGKMLVEIAEFHAFKTAEIEQLNAVITCRTDRYRAPYDRHAADHLRSCVFAATTNRNEWNRDDTGARRFLPIECGAIDIDWLKQWRTQLFAEAVKRYHAGEPWWDLPLSLAQDEQAKRRGEDAIEPALRYWCSKTPDVSIPAFMEHGLTLQGIARFDRQLQQRVTSTLRAWGYVASFKKEGYATIRVWRLPGGRQQMPLEEPDEPM